MGHHNFNQKRLRNKYGKKDLVLKDLKLKENRNQKNCGY